MSYTLDDYLDDILDFEEECFYLEQWEEECYYDEDEFFLRDFRDEEYDDLLLYNTHELEQWEEFEKEVVWPEPSYFEYTDEELDNLFRGYNDNYNPYTNPDNEYYDDEFYTGKKLHNKRKRKKKEKPIYKSWKYGEAMHKAYIENEQRNAHKKNRIANPMKYGDEFTIYGNEVYTFRSSKINSWLDDEPFSGTHKKLREKKRKPWNSRWFRSFKTIPLKRDASANILFVRAKRNVINLKDSWDDHKKDKSKDFYQKNISWKRLSKYKKQWKI